MRHVAACHILERSGSAVQLKRGQIHLLVHRGHVHFQEQPMQDAALSSIRGLRGLVDQGVRARGEP